MIDLKKILAISLVALLLFPLATLAQNDKLPDHKQANNSSKGCGNSCGGCANGCTSNIFDFIFGRHRDILELKELDPRITSVEWRSYYGYTQAFGSSLSHTIGFDLGIFSSEFYLHNLSYGIPAFAYNFKSYDWQILGLNLVRTLRTDLKLGSGFLYDPLQSRFYHEYFGYFGFFPANGSIIFEVESRVAVSYKPVDLYFNETNALCLIRLFALPKLYTYLSLGGLMQVYNDKSTYVAAQAGLIFNFHPESKK